MGYTKAELEGVHNQMKNSDTTINEIINQINSIYNSLIIYERQDSDCIRLTPKSSEDKTQRRLVKILNQLNTQDIRQLNQRFTKLKSYTSKLKLLGIGMDLSLKIIISEHKFITVMENLGFLMETEFTLDCSKLENGNFQIYLEDIEAIKNSIDIRGLNFDIQSITDIHILTEQLVMSVPNSTFKKSKIIFDSSTIDKIASAMKKYNIQYFQEELEEDTVADIDTVIDTDIAIDESIEIEACAVIDHLNSLYNIIYKKHKLLNITNTYYRAIKGKLSLIESKVTVEHYGFHLTNLGYCNFGKLIDLMQTLASLDSEEMINQNQDINQSQNLYSQIVDQCTIIFNNYDTNLTI
jgi:hypothetical protein